MFSTQLFLTIVLLVGASAKHIQWEDTPDGIYEEYRYPVYDVDEDVYYQHPSYLSSARVRRQVQGSLTLNSDGRTELGAKVPLVGNDKNVLSAIGSVGIDSKMNTKGLGLALDNVKGHGLSVMKETIPGFGSRLTDASQTTPFHNDNHNIGANAFIARNMPDHPSVPNFNTVGGGLDYTYNNKIGASLGMAHTPFLDRKDYSAMSNLNLFHNPTTNVDFGAGFKKFETPSFNSGWEPNFMFKFGRTF